MVAAGVTVHWIFAAFDAIPTVRPESFADMMSFGIDTHTFWLNIGFIPAAAILLYVRWRALRQQDRARGAATESGSRPR